jgi:hypothetical protein
VALLLLQLTTIALWHCCCSVVVVAPRSDGVVMCCYGVVAVHNAALQRWLHCNVAMALWQSDSAAAYNTPVLLWKCCSVMLRCCCGSVVAQCCGIALAVL